MINAKASVFVSSLLLSSYCAGQEIGLDSANSVERSAGFFGDDRGPEVFPKREGTRFFEILAATYQTTERPFSFEETVSMSSVIGRGYFADVIPGRAISHKRRPGLPPIETVLLKITASSVLKGDHRQFYYVEYPSANTMIDELRQGLYAGEILFLLRPAHAFYSDADVEISTSREAQAELSGDEAIYNFTLQSSLFTMSLLDASKLTSPLGASRDLLDLYTGIRSLDGLTDHIAEIRREAVSDGLR